MGRILDALPDQLREKLGPLAERARLPFAVPLDRLISDHLEAILNLRRLGASVGAIAQVLAELGVTRNGKPVGAATLSKAISRARASVIVGPAIDHPNGTTADNDRGGFVAVHTSSNVTEDGDLRPRTANGGTQQRSMAGSGGPRHAEDVRDGKRPNAAKRGSARQTAAIEGKAQCLEALADGTPRAEATSDGSSRRAVNPDNRDTPGRRSKVNAASGTARSERSRFEASLAQGRLLNFVQEDDK